MSLANVDNDEDVDDDDELDLTFRAGRTAKKIIWAQRLVVVTEVFKSHQFVSQDLKISKWYLCLVGISRSDSEILT